MTELIYKELSYKLVGLAYQIDNEIGSCLEEEIYSKAFEKLLLKDNIKYKKELYCPIKIDGETIAKRFLDFLVEDKIIVEIKVNNYRYKSVFTQLNEYLRLNNIKLGLIIRFSKDGVNIKRVLNIN